MTREEIANILKISRLQAGLTQKQAAEAVGKKQQTLASWETAQSQPDTNTLFLLFDVYGRSLDEAFGYANTSRHGKNPQIAKYLYLFEQLSASDRETVLKFIEFLLHNKSVANTSHP